MSTDPNAPASGVMSIREEDEEWIANKAARLADALIAALNKETK